VFTTTSRPQFYSRSTAIRQRYDHSTICATTVWRYGNLFIYFVIFYLFIFVYIIIVAIVVVIIVIIIIIRFTCFYKSSLSGRSRRLGDYL